MRTAKLSEEDILRAEKAKDDRKRSRRRGYAKMEERDAGTARIRNYNGSEVRMLWHIPEDRREEGLCYSGVSDGMFILEFAGKKLVFDAEEFRKWLRWC